MSFAKIFLLSPVLFRTAGVGAVPAPALSVTFYDAFPTEFAPTLTISATPVSGFTAENNISILGVSTGSKDTEITYSIRIYISIPVETVTALTDGATSPLPAEVIRENYTLVESSGGFWASFSSFASGTRNGFHETCMFDANGGASAFCMEIIYSATSSGSLQTVTESFEASKTLLVVLPVPTSSSNTAISTSQGPYWKMGLYVSMFCVVVLVV
ncbi:hypothetical protein BT96DRAFT_998860 [Gymnopus androsaceus JB14]|uniref:Ubiquitin 3 binding protein But2 C-terminal domain-containing protein n=1 Tax=Gymnopus androsaceus JB14 TaxID=1447944 RepID=A0A6A4H770_9AGAR|nr:hypothetical protein BT96DRAFT_998860 [Gymnopus androsaceus JB14]